MSAAVVASSSSSQTTEDEAKNQAAPDQLDDDTETNTRQKISVSSMMDAGGVAKYETKGAFYEHGNHNNSSNRRDYAMNGDVSAGKADQVATLAHQNFGESELTKSAFFESDAKPSAASSDAGSTFKNQRSHDQSPTSPIPSDLLAILKDVAETGTCSWLPWEESEDDRNSRGLYSGGGIPLAAAAVSAQAPLPAHRQSHNPSGGKRHHHYHGGMSNNKRARSSTSSGMGVASKTHKKTAMQHRHYYPGGGSATTTTTTATAAASPGGTRKKYHNGLHPRPSSSRRFADSGSSSRNKHPLFLIRTTSSASNTSTIFSPGSVGSGRTSGSEPEESSQYECDSEGTSATSNSELSFGDARSRTSDLRKRRGLGGGSNSSFKQKTRSAPTQSPEVGSPPPPNFKSLKEAFRIGIDVVLDHFYKHRGGYKPSWAEKGKKNTATPTINQNNGSIASHKQPGRETFTDRGSANDVKMSSREAMMKEGFSMNGPGNSLSFWETTSDEKQTEASQDLTYRERKELLLNMLDSSNKSVDGTSSKSSRRPWLVENNEGPPFTIQRIAEVLIAPERYYTQTHKLCNCLEKLLLVTSSVTAFGGSSGGDTSQTRLEETELAALADEKSRLHAEFRQSRRKLRRKSGSPTAEDVPSDSKDADGSSGKEADVENTKTVETLEDSEESRRRASSGSDSDGEDSNAQRGDESNSQEEARERMEAAARASLRTKFDHVGIDPHSAVVNNHDVLSIAENRGMTNSPPPPSLNIAAAPAMLPGGHGGLLRHHPGSPTSPDKPHSPLARAPSPILFNSASNGNEGSSSPPMPQLHEQSNPSHMHLLQMHHAAAMAGVSPFEILNSSSVGGAGASAAAGQGLTVKDMDIESRSSASSDVDSESDVSFDDSASDRSDGSDSGQHNEPLTAARAMALNRMQQQQRLQSRVLTSLQQQQHVERPPSDNEYQSGDSIDSTRAEDSGGSDSSSSDLAD